ncbi:MAG TPA: c-type cytochrome [Polyangiaceae bacterium]|jgi:predicted CXXCH cytochrome family protein|nr:c-type cytochrome [Polyangiaceae bacterium]
MNPSNQERVQGGARSRKRALLVGVAALLMLAIGAGFRYILRGGMSARQTPSAVESFVAQTFVKWSIPGAAKALRSPLGIKNNDADVAAGRELYAEKCQSCHGYDGGGKTDVGGGLFPPPISLRRVALSERKRTDGELFYLIRNGVRNTGMPGWQLTDQQTWQLVLFIRNLPTTAVPESGAKSERAAAAAARRLFVGSASCKACHGDIYARWSKTAMANVVRDPREHADAIIPDLSQPDPLLTFTKADIAFVYGSIWKQRYFKKVGDDYFPLPAQWDIIHKKWRPYLAKDDWWVPFYPADNAQRPTGPTCDGCHSVNYDVGTKTVTEWNVGCERCHGPGSEHVKVPLSSNIVNAAREDYVSANDVCVQCHSQGRPLHNPIAGRYYDWPVGYDVTMKLSDYWKLEEHKLGETSFTHFGDGTAHKNRMQGNDFASSLMYTHGVACSTCHDTHGSPNNAELRKPAAVLCLDCHGPKSPNGPFESTLEAHTHHAAGSAGSECIACHMPKIEQTLGDVNVRSHTFRFVSPALTDSLHIPNACNVCHADQSTAWALSALQSWAGRSPWRVNN